MDIEMSANSTFRDMQRFMFAYKINIPIYIVVNPQHCRAANEELYRRPLTAWIRKLAPITNVVFLKITRRGDSYVN